MQVRFGRESEDACNVHPEESDQNDLQDGFEKWYDTGRNVSMSKMLTLQLVCKWLHYICNKCVYTCLLHFLLKLRRIGRMLRKTIKIDFYGK